MYNKGKQFENHFFIYGPKCEKIVIFWGYFGGPEGVFNDQTKPILLSSYPLTHFGSAKYSNGFAVSSGSSMGTGLFLWNEILILLLISGLYI